jgi:hypothetical protein
MHQLQNGETMVEQMRQLYHFFKQDFLKAQHCLFQHMLLKDFQDLF